MCRILRVSKSGMYKWLKRPESKAEERRKVLAVQIKKIFEKGHRVPGYRTIHKTLCERGFPCSLGLVSRICRAHGIRSCTYKGR